MSSAISIIKGSMMSNMVFRFNFICAMILNIFYIIFIYFLWQAIYITPDNIINGMNFYDAFIYLSLGSILATLFYQSLEWEISEEIISGNIVLRLIKPFDFQLYQFYSSLGKILVRCCTSAVPLLLIIVVFFNVKIYLINNIFFFFISVFFAFIISFLIEFFIGVCVFYTESTWGICIAKNAIIGILSGLMIPLNFFPERIKTILLFFPFQAIYNIPILILVKKINIYCCLKFIIVQISWVVILFILTRAFYLRTLKNITINGG